MAVGDMLTVEVGNRQPAPWDVADLVVGGGFEVEETVAGRSHVRLRARRMRSLPDTVGPGMRALVCGLNPSLVAADAGYGYAGRNNRFWPAAMAAGLVSRPRDPLHALLTDGVGITDLVKRATTTATGLSREEYRAGRARVERLVAWLAPRTVVFVGLAGWRAACDRRASPGWQPAGLAGTPTYVMPSTSGLNARTSLDELVRHLGAALDGPPGGRAPVSPPVV